MGKVLRINLSTGKTHIEQIDNEIARKYIGGAGLAANYLYDEVPPGVSWDSPDNPVIITTGPLTGTRVAGSGTYFVATINPLNNLAGITQSNGMLGAFLKFCGFDAVIIQGQSPKWSYLRIQDNAGRLYDAGTLLGKDTRETEEILQKTMKYQCSVHSIGPAGENLVRFACLAGDKGHTTGKTGVGAVLGAKRLKAVVVKRGNSMVPVKSPEPLKDLSTALWENARDLGFGGDHTFADYGTLGSISRQYTSGMLPVRNLSTSDFSEYQLFDGRHLRTSYQRHPLRCWACRFDDTGLVELNEGKFAGRIANEPFFDSAVSMGPMIGQPAPDVMIMLSDMIYTLGMDYAECAWLIGWLTECFEKGYFTSAELDGLEMKWGNARAIATVLKKIAHRDGIGDWLADGMKQAADRAGGKARECAVYTMKGTTPRPHDHRTSWFAMLDTCVSNTGTVEASGNMRNYYETGVPLFKNEFDPLEVAAFTAAANGRRQFDNSLGVCLHCVHSIHLELETLRAVTGYEIDIPEAMLTGKRIVNLLRMFNTRHGLTSKMEVPSHRYGSAPNAGPAKGLSALDYWPLMRQTYYERMG